MQRKCKNWITSYLEYTERSEPPTLFKEWTALSVLSAALQRKCVLKWGPFVEVYPNLYVVLVSKSGKCRKGTAMGPGLYFLENLGISLAAESITREALIRELKEASAQHIDPLTGEITVHASITIYSQELAVFLGYQNQQLIIDLTDWFDCRRNWKYRTKGCGTDDIKSVWVSLFGATTPTLMQSTLPYDAIGGGLTSRIIFVYEDVPGKLVAIPFETPKEVALREDLSFDLEQIHMLGGNYKVTDEWLELWEVWYLHAMTHPAIDDIKFDGYNTRRPVHVMKIALIHNASRGGNLILGKEDFHYAVNLLERTEIKMPKTFMGVGRSDKSDILGEVLEQLYLLGTTNLKVLSKRFQRDVTRSELAEILIMLQESGSCKIDNTKKPPLITYISDKEQEDGKEK